MTGLRTWPDTNACALLGGGIMKKQLRIALLFLLVFAMLLCSGCGQKTTKRSTQEIIEEMVVDYGSYGEEADQKIKALLNDTEQDHSDCGGFKYSELVSMLCELHAFGTK